MKNKLLFAIFAVFLLLVTAYAASAQTIITSTPPSTGSVGQLYTYKMTTNVTGATFGITSAPSGFAVNPSTGDFSWAPFANGVFNVTLFAQENATSLHFQQFTITVGGTSSAQGIEITEIRVDVNGEREDTMSSPGTIDYDDFELGDEVALKITVENMFNTRNDSTEFRNVDIEVRSNDLDDADDLDDSISRLEANEEEDVTFSFTLDPENVDPSDAPFDITIDVEAETEDGDIYRDTWTIRLDMETKSRDLSIYNLELAPISVSACSENRIRVNLDYRNIGSRDLDNAGIRMKIADLSISKIVGGIEVDSGDDGSFNDFVTIPRGARAGTYLLEVDAFPVRTSSTVSSTEATEVTVVACSSQSNQSTGGSGSSGSGSGSSGTPSGSNGGTVVIPDITITGTPVSSAVGRKGIFGSESALYIALLVVIAALLVTVIALLAAKMRD